MKVAAALLLAVVVGLCSSQTIPLPSITEQEVQEILTNVPAVVDCLIEGKTAGRPCHPLTSNVRRFLPELAARNFQCNCDAQKHINSFQKAIQRDRTQFRRIASWVRENGLLAK